MRSLTYDPAWRGLLVAAPRGWGKTRALQAAAAQTGLHVVQLPLASVRAGDDPAALFEQGLAEARDGALLIDDLHLAQGRLDAPIRNAFESGNARILVASRFDPGPQWPLLAAGGAIGCWGLADLALSADEVAAMFRAETVQAPPPSWRPVLAAAAGWPVAVEALAAASGRLQSGRQVLPDPPWPILLDLVESLLWSDLSQDLRETVRKAALLLRVRSGVLEALGASRTDVAELGRRFFLLGGTAPGELRLAPGLAAQVRERDPASAATRRQWHLTAADACDREEEWEAGIAHLLSAGPRSTRGHEPPVAVSPSLWLDALDPERRSKEPLLRLWHGRLEALAGRAADADREFRAAREAFEARGDGAGVFSCLVAAATAALAGGARDAFDKAVAEAAPWEAAGSPEDQVAFLLALGSLCPELAVPDASDELVRAAIALPPLGALEAQLTRTLRAQEDASTPGALAGGAPSATAAGMPAGLVIRALGPLRVHLPDGREVQWGRRKAKVLLGFLLLSPRGADRLSLAEALAGGAIGAAAEHALRVVVHALRKSLEPDQDRNQTSRFVLFDQDRYRLAPHAVASSDLADLEALLDEGDAARAAGDAGQAAARYQVAAATYTGDLLDEEVLAPFFEVERTALRDRVVEGLRQAADFKREGGGLAESETIGRRMTEIHPTDVIGHRTLIETFLAANRRDQARNQVRRYELICQRTIGISPDLEDLEALLD